MKAQRLQDSGTYIKTVHSAETGQPQKTLPTNAVDKEVFAGEHGLAESLSFCLFGNICCTGKEAVFANGPALSAIQMEHNNVSKQGRAQSDITRADIGRLSHSTTSQELGHRDLDLASQLHRRRHVNHGARLGAHGSARLQGEIEHGIGVAMHDTVCAA